MSIALIDDEGRAIPIKPASKADLPTWLEQNPQHADWVKANSFIGEPGSLVMSPGQGGAPVGVLARDIINTPAEDMGCDGSGDRVASVCGDADDVFLDPIRRRAYVACGAGVVDSFDVSGLSPPKLNATSMSAGARTALFDPLLDRLFVAAPARSGRQAAILVLRPSP